MLFKRKIYSRFLDWKEQWASSRALLVQGARRIGKSTIVEEFAKKHIGSTDYRNASKRMREILVNTVNEDLTEYVKKISASTIVIAGEYDVDVPLDELNLYKNYIDDCAVIVYEGCTHYAYLERINQTINILNSFLKEGK